MKDFISLRKEKGLTLVETVVAMLIAAITLVGFLEVCSLSALMLKNIKCRMRAINIAQAEIEDLKALEYDGIDVSAFTPYRSTSVIIDEGPTALPEDDIVGEMRTMVSEVIYLPLNGKKIAVEVRWDVLGKSKWDILETVVYSH